MAGDKCKCSPMLKYHRGDCPEYQVGVPRPTSFAWAGDLGDPETLGATHVVDVRESEDATLLRCCLRCHAKHYGDHPHMQLPSHEDNHRYIGLDRPLFHQAAQLELFPDSR